MGLCIANGKNGATDSAPTRRDVLSNAFRGLVLLSLPVVGSTGCGDSPLSTPADLPSEPTKPDPIKRAPLSSLEKFGLPMPISAGLADLANDGWITYAERDAVGIQLAEKLSVGQDLSWDTLRAALGETSIDLDHDTTRTKLEFIFGRYCAHVPSALMPYEKTPLFKPTGDLGSFRNPDAADDKGLDVTRDKHGEHYFIAVEPPTKDGASLALGLHNKVRGPYNQNVEEVKPCPHGGWIVRITSQDGSYDRPQTVDQILQRIPAQSDGVRLGSTTIYVPPGYGKLEILRKSGDGYNLDQEISLEHHAQRISNIKRFDTLMKPLEQLLRNGPEESAQKAACDFLGLPEGTSLTLTLNPRGDAIHNGELNGTFYLNEQKFTFCYFVDTGRLNLVCMPFVRSDVDINEMLKVTASLREEQRKKPVEL